jgi:hypothetical protein
VAVGLRQVDAAVVVRVERGQPEAENEAVGAASPAAAAQSDRKRGT